MMRTYYLRSFGCQMNDHDAERMAALLDGEGLVRVAEPDDADLLVYNTCTVRRSADQRFEGHLGEAARLKALDPERLVVVTGCLPQVEQESLFERYPVVDAAVGPQSLEQLREVVGGGRGGFFEDAGILSGDLPGRRARPFQAWVQVMAGCTNCCTYCIVPHARGPERSRLPESVVEEVRGLVADGVAEVTLLGQNVNAYGLDLPGGEAHVTFAGLLRRLDRIDGLRRVRFTTSHPRDLSDELIAAMAGLDSVCEHLHLPAQSGSDRVLAAMGRGYTMEWYLGRVEALRAAVPDIAVTTDLMVAFPGETERDFERTLELVDRAAFDAAFTFVFSPRPGTPAASLDGAVPAVVARERIERLVEATQKQSRAARRRGVGAVHEVLVEGASRDGRLLRGRTRQNVTVNFAGPGEPGALVDVLVTAATSTTLHGRALQGGE
jgi:tRNA-2-methylthio-N6-dimethylallyladenosine synthase